VQRTIADKADSYNIIISHWAAPRFGPSRGAATHRNLQGLSTTTSATDFSNTFSTIENQSCCAMKVEGVPECLLNIASSKVSRTTCYASRWEMVETQGVETPPVDSTPGMALQL
jgi:hypothetical protein